MILRLLMRQYYRLWKVSLSEGIVISKHIITIPTLDAPREWNRPVIDCSEKAIRIFATERSLTTDVLAATGGPRAPLQAYLTLLNIDTAEEIAVSPFL